MKRLTLLVVAALLLSLVGCGQSTSKSTLKPSPATDFEYSYNDNKGYIVINGYIGSNPDVIVPSEIEGKPVGAIQKSGSGYANVESIVLPDTLELVTFDVFMNCDKLHTVDLGGTKEIWDKAFLGCDNLKTVIFSSRLKSIGIESFSNCKSLEKAILPNGLEHINHRAFSKCTSLKEVFIPNTVNQFGMEIFTYDVSIEKVIFEPGLERIAGYALFGASTNVKTLTIPNSVKEIEQYCFAGLVLDSITFLGDAPTMWESEFANCPSNFTIYYDPNTSGWDNTPLSQYNLVAK